MKSRRPAVMTVFHSLWIALTTALLLSSCTVVPTPASYSYQQTACPPGVAPAAPAPQAVRLAPGTIVPPPEADNAQANAQPNPPPVMAPQAVPAACYTAVPSSYTYDYYPGVAAYPGYYPYAYPYYGPTIGFYGSYGFYRRH